jgi:PAS domain S-box-containing protein
MKRISAPEHEDPVNGKQTDGASRDNELRYRILFDLAPVGVYSCDASGVILDYNTRATVLWGRKPKAGDTDERFCGSFRMYRPDGTFMPHEQCPMGEVLAGKVPGVHDGEVHIERPDGSHIVVIVNIAPVRNNRGKVTGAINCFYDVTDRRRTEEALLDREAGLRAANEKLESVVQKRTAALRHLSARLMRVQDEEHRRIARNLHDSLGQYLANVKMKLELLTGSITTEQEKLLSAALESVERSIAETRTLSFLLHPPLLDELGFASAARWYTDEFAKRSGIEVKLDLPDGIDRLPEMAEIALFRILQESLTNVHRHSGSSSVEIGLSVNDHQASLAVRDFGRGIPPDLMQGSDLDGSRLGVGLSGMRERVSDLGGNFAIESNSHGTAIIVALPLAVQPSEKARTSQVTLAKNSAA